MDEEIRIVGKCGLEREVESRSEMIPVGFQVHTMNVNRFLQRGAQFPVWRLLRNFSGDSPWTAVSVQLLKIFKERSPPSSLLKAGMFPQVPNWLRNKIIVQTGSIQEVSWDLLSPAMLTILCNAEEVGLQITIWTRATQPSLPSSQLGQSCFRLHRWSSVWWWRVKFPYFGL